MCSQVIEVSVVDHRNLIGFMHCLLKSGLGKRLFQHSVGKMALESASEICTVGSNLALTYEGLFYVRERVIGIFQSLCEGELSKSVNKKPFYCRIKSTWGSRAWVLILE